MKLTLGITGHRDVIETLKLQREIYHYLKSLIESKPYDEVILLSPLADGADRWVADIFLSLKATHPTLRLVVPLPFTLERYEEDFDASSIQEFRAFLGQASEVFVVKDTHKDGYLSVGRYVADHSDILLALWDGADNHKVGGTGDIVNYAYKHGKKIKHFLCRRRGGLE